MRRMAPQPPGPGLPLQAPSAKTSTALSALWLAVIIPAHVNNVVPARHLDQRNRPRRPLAPGRRNQAHAHAALDCAHDIDAARNRPPAVSCAFHEREALQPPGLRERWYVAAES